MGRYAKNILMERIHILRVDRATVDCLPSMASVNSHGGEILCEYLSISGSADRGISEFRTS
jgi:hypothetical protein